MKRLITALLVTVFLCLGYTTSVLASHWQVVRAQQLREVAEERVFKIQFISMRGYLGGTGFLLQTDKGEKFVVTNKHVCDAIEFGVGPFLQGKQSSKLLPTKIIKASTKTDLCLIEPVGELVTKVTGFKLAPAPLETKSSVFVYGHPFLGPLTTNTGFFDKMSTTYDARGSEVTSGHLTFPIYPGSSGSPVLNIAGEVVGVVFAYDSKGTGLFVEREKLEEFLNE